MISVSLQMHLAGPASVCWDNGYRNGCVKCVWSLAREGFHVLANQFQFLAFDAAAVAAIVGVCLSVPSLGGTL